MVILGIDPGTTRVGYGVIKKDGSKLLHVKSGIFNTSKGSDAQKLVKLEEELLKIVNEVRPEKVGLEKLFFAKNRKTAIGVAQARGVIVSVIAKKSMPIIEMSPPQIKLAVTGDGKATKDAVAKMVRYFLNIPTEHLIDDATDALAVAIAASNAEGTD